MLKALIIAATVALAACSSAPDGEANPDAFGPPTGLLDADIERMAKAQAAGRQDIAFQHIDELALQESMRVFIGQVVDAYFQVSFSPPPGVEITPEIRQSLDVAKAMTSREVEGRVMPMFSGEGLWMLMQTGGHDGQSFLHDLSKLEVRDGQSRAGIARLRHVFGVQELSVMLVFTRGQDRWVWSGVEPTEGAAGMDQIVDQLKNPPAI